MQYLQNAGDNIFIIVTVSIYFAGIMYLGFRGFKSTKLFLIIFWEVEN